LSFFFPVLASSRSSPSFAGGRLAALRRELSESAELVFINPTFEMKIPTPTGEFVGSFSEGASEWDDAHAPRCWWNAPEGADMGDLRYRNCLHEEFDQTLRVRFPLLFTLFSLPYDLLPSKS
jgi:hypothetical protein